MQNSFLLAGPINRMGLLTLPDLFRRKYGQLMEVIVSCIEITSITFLMAGA
jgi:SSS family solute:Na+ symporter